jgi:alpha-beta hydrolase superfamily lysophospholipase
MIATQSTENGLYYRQWSEVETPKACIMLIHGLGEHCQRYDSFAEHLNQAGYAVYSMDLPNHGKSEGLKGHVDSFDVFTNAASGLYQRIKSQNTNAPVYLLGHSMGGLISARYLIDHQDDFAGAILSGPAIESPQTPPAWQVALMKFISLFAPRLGMLELDGSLVSRDPAVVKAYMDDPLINSNKMSAKLLVEFFKTMAEVNIGAGEISLPILIMHGEADKLTAPSGSKWLHENVSSNDKSLNIYPELFHEIFNEPEGPSIFAEVVNWLDERQALST